MQGMIGEIKRILKGKQVGRIVLKHS